MGGLVLSRRTPGLFPEEAVSVVQMFAAQSAVAIDNARLFQARPLEEASQHKSQFLANMSHELRTPLNAIIGYSEMLQEEAEDIDADAFLPDLQRINAPGKHLLGLINDILDLSKIEAGRMDLFLETFEIGPMIRDVQAIVQPLVEKNGNTLVVACPDDLGPMHADQTKVRQTLFNLLSNAAKFTEHGEIDRAASCESERRATPHRDSQLATRNFQRQRHRHRDDRGAARAALRGVLPGRGLHPQQVRRDRGWAGDQPPLLPPDGRRPHRRQRLRPGLAPTGRRRGKGRGGGRERPPLPSERERRAGDREGGPAEQGEGEATA